MLMVRASIKPSPIHGWGCFTDEPIAKGQVVWVLDGRIDVVMPYADIASLPPPAQAFVLMYGYAAMEGDRRVMILCGDHAKHMNHTENPNLIEAGPNNEQDIAARDIAAGEELTCNYYHFDLDAELKLGR